jgi:hypothetical protein
MSDVLKGPPSVQTKSMEATIGRVRTRSANQLITDHVEFGLTRVTGGDEKICAWTFVDFEYEHSSWILAPSRTVDPPGPFGERMFSSDENYHDSASYYTVIDIF